MLSYRGIVQLAERWSPKPNVEGSSPSAPVDECLKTVVFRHFLCLFYGRKLRTKNKLKFKRLQDIITKETVNLRGYKYD